MGGGRIERIELCLAALRAPGPIAPEIRAELVELLELLLDGWTGSRGALDGFRAALSAQKRGWIRAACRTLPLHDNAHQPYPMRKLLPAARARLAACGYPELDRRTIASELLEMQADEATS